MRSMIDKMTASQWNAAIKSCHSAESPLLVDAGSKFNVANKLAKAAFRNDNQTQSKTLPIQDTEFNDWDTIIDDLAANPELVPVFLVRPEEGNYNEMYYHSSPEPETLTAGSNAYVVVFKTTLQQLLERLVEAKADHMISVLMNDVHYYIPQLPEYDLDLTFYVSGLQFETLPGTYYLPCSEGSYSVYTNQEGENRILMRTNGSQTEYDHLNVAPISAETCVDYGWIRFFTWSGKDYSKNFYIPSSAQQVSGYPQANYFAETYPEKSYPGERFQTAI